MQLVMRHQRPHRAPQTPEDEPPGSPWAHFAALSRPSSANRQEIYKQRCNIKGTGCRVKRTKEHWGGVNGTVLREYTGTSNKECFR